MNLVPAVWKQSRRAFSRAFLVISALAVLLGGLVAVPSGVASADQTVTSGGPFTVTSPGGDMVATYDAAGIDPASASSFLNTSWPEGVGLSPGPSLSDLLQATWRANSSLEGSFFPDPPTFSGGSATIVSDGAGGSDITIDIPAADVQANAQLPSWARGMLSQLAGIFASIVAFGTCEALLLFAAIPALLTTGPAGEVVLGVVGTAFCSGLGSASWTLVATIVGQALSGGPFDATFWWGTLGATLTAFVGGAVFSPLLTPIFRTAVSSVLSGLGKGLSVITGFLSKWTGGKSDVVFAAIGNFFARVARLFRSRMPGLDIELGTVAPAATGQFQLLPLPDLGTPFVVPLCMDAYGVTGGRAAPGQAVAINSCDGSANQDFDYYPDGMVSVYGLCMAPGGGTSSIGTPLVTLEPCDGSADEHWVQSGQALVNQGGGGCLDDPNLTTTPGTQLDLFPCNGSQAQNWRKPTAQPCDIYAANGTGCVAAYSTTRAMYADYDGPLYQVQRASDGTTADIGLLSTGGDADAAAQDSFCASTTCVITEIYDQSPVGNNLTIEAGGGAAPGADHGAVANALPITIGGNKAYGLDVEPGVGYRNDATIGVATSGEPEGMYMVASGTHVNSQCCFDFGNGEANNDDNHAAHMDAVNLSPTCFGPGGVCTGSGPWVQADLEDGLFMGSKFTNTANLGNATPFVTAMLGNNGQSAFSLNGGDATSGGLTTWYNGALPAGYAPMQQEGAVLLGTGGDNSNADVGSWFEGVMTAGDPSQAASDAVQANIVAAGYAGNTNPSGGSADGVTPSAAGPAVVHAAGATGASASGYSSVYTVDSSNGDLQETYLPAMGDNWTTQDLSATGGDLPGTPAVMPGTQPVSIVHCGYTSVYTVDAASGDLQETYLPAIGDSWTTQDLSAKYLTPPTDATPTALVHAAGATGSAAACGYTSVYTVDRDGDLQETYLPLLGGPWTTQDLSAKYLTPPIQPGTSPVAIVHCGFTSVYTVDGGSHDVQETYLQAIGGPWKTQDLSANYETPKTDTTPTAVMHSAGAPGATAACGYTSVYSVDQSNRHLDETYLPNAGFPGDRWISQDLSASSETPAVAPGTAPVALVHLGFTSVYTVDQGSDQVQETALQAIGDSWKTQSLSANYLTPATDQTPIVLLHPDASGNIDWVSVYTINELDNHLQETYLPNTGFPGDPWVTQDLSAKYLTPTVAVQQSSESSWSVDHAGYASVYTVDLSPTGAGNDLQETYLPAMGDNWTTQDLSSKYLTPVVAPQSAPAALVHDGFTSVYTVDLGPTGAGDLQETYLPALGDPWKTQDLSATAHTPAVAANSSPSALFHDGYDSVYTVDASGDLQETYLPGAGFPGDAWQIQDLSTLAKTPKVMPGTSPEAILHDGWDSVYTIDANGDLQETYLAMLGGAWVTQDLSLIYHTPKTDTTPAAVFHDGYTSVYTVDNSPSGDLQETYLPAIGDNWTTQDLTANYHAPTSKQGTRLGPIALYHTGYTSVYYLNGSSSDVEEAYLPAIGGAWQSQDLTTGPSRTPTSDQTPSPLVHYAANGGLTWTSIYTVDNSPADDLQETYLPAIGDNWTTQDLTVKAQTPPV
jgi:Alpha-L-arabinofuranosidase B, catalytic/Ricin-type beta-trefoil lectin domain